MGDVNDPFISHTKASTFASNWGFGRAPQPAPPSKVAPPGDYKTSQKYRPPPPSTTKLFVFPLVYFVVTALSFAFLWDFWKPLPVIIAGAMLCSVFDQSSLATPRDSQGNLSNGMFLPSLSGRDGPAAMRVWLHIVVAWLAVFLGGITGINAEENYMGQFFAITMGVEYSNVLASTSGAAYKDAGKVWFAGSSQVDTTRSVGFQEYHTYCVAPIIDENQGRNSVSFWAIGFDCCSARGEFECGAAGEASHRGGVRAPPDGIFAKDRAVFLKAIKQASAVHSIDVDEDVILLRWVQNPDAVAVRKLFSALGSIGIGAALFSLLVLLLTFGGIAAEEHVVHQQALQAKQEQGGGMPRFGG